MLIKPLGHLGKAGIFVLLPVPVGTQFHQTAKTRLAFPQVLVRALALGDVGDEPLQRHQPAARIVHAQAAFPHPFFRAVLADDPVFDDETPALRQAVIDFPPRPLPVLRMHDAFVGNRLIEQKLLDTIAGQFETAFADQLHGPLRIIATAICHARQVAHQGLGPAFLLEQGLFHGRAPLLRFQTVEREGNVLRHALEKQYQVLFEEPGFSRVVSDCPPDHASPAQRECSRRMQSVAMRQVAPWRHLRITCEVVADVTAAFEYRRRDRSVQLRVRAIERNGNPVGIGGCRPAGGNADGAIRLEVSASDPGHAQAAMLDGNPATFLQQGVAVAQAGNRLAGEGQRRVQIGQAADAPVRSLAFGYVTDEDLDGLAPAIQKRRGHDFHVDDAAVRAHVALLQPRHTLAAVQTRDAFARRLAVIRVD